MLRNAAGRRIAGPSGGRKGNQAVMPRAGLRGTGTKPQRATLPKCRHLLSGPWPWFRPGCAPSWYGTASW
ncbi:hypothetical protein GCM10010430_57580 [Kitasatospora cystarginea]|uniref:Uncharacterized protein n=1 Tax=Kitasatospora cystarginea TaxID=58350 RepID=A0ABN3EP54_9ACTN